MAATKLGHYILEKKIGFGGLGEVYRAYDSYLHRPVAVKILRDDSSEGTGRENLLAEARASSALNHPNICTIYEVGEADGQAYIAMELVDGKPLRDLIPSQGMDVETAVRYG
ncbi:MAG: protein kinase domain-containing protein, partial [Candidatus Dormibacteraceae bacterium]